MRFHNKPNKTIRSKTKGFTLIELTVTAVSSAILVVSIGAILVGSQKQWGQLNTRINGSTATGSYAATRAFDLACRRATWKTCDLNAAQNDLTLYCYQPGSTASIPEKYAQFYLSNNQLWVRYGDQKSGSWAPNTSIAPTEILLAENIQSVKFGIQSKAISMIVKFNPDTKMPPVSYTAVRNNY